MADESIEQRQDKYNFKDGVTFFFVETENLLSRYLDKLLQLLAC